MAKRYALMIWKDDKPITGNVMKMETIVFPRKPLECYEVGDVVTARLRGYGTPEGVIGKIGGEDDKEAMYNILAGNGFAELLENLKIITGMDHQEPAADHASANQCNSSVDSQVKKTKRKSTTTPMKTSTTKSKKMKQTLNIEKAGENLELLELELEMQDSQEQQVEHGPVETNNTSSILMETFNVLNDERHTETRYDLDIAKLTQENSEMKTKITNLELANSQLWQTITEIKENISWLYYNKQQIQVTSSLLNSSPSVNTAGVSSTFPCATACSSSDADCSSLSQNNLQLDTSSVSAKQDRSTVPHQDESESGACNYTKEQLSSIISHVADFCKASKLLFRRLYKEEEYVGRSLTGHKANSKSQLKPAIEDKSRLKLLYDVIQQKWPYATTAMINGKIAEVLKPSRQKKD